MNALVVAPSAHVSTRDVACKLGLQEQDCRLFCTASPHLRLLLLSDALVQLCKPRRACTVALLEVFPGYRYPTKLVSM